MNHIKRMAFYAIRLAYMHKRTGFCAFPAGYRGSTPGDSLHPFTNTGA